jgi:hypothetical protein
MRPRRSRNNTVYVFRCGESGLYALTQDRTGKLLPSEIYPRVHWQLKRRITLGRGKYPIKTDLIKSTLKAIRMQGFYLTHAADDSVALLAQDDQPRTNRSPQPG